MLCVMTHRTMDGPGVTPTRHRKVSGYTMSNNTTTKDCKTLMSCFTVMLTDSENSNMGFLHERTATDRPATVVKRTLVGRNEVLTRFATGNGLPLLPTDRGVASSTGNPMRPLGQGGCLRRMKPLTSCRMGYQFIKTHNAELTGADRRPVE